MALTILMSLVKVVASLFMFVGEVLFNMTPDQKNRYKAKSTRLLWASIFVWIVLFLIIRATFHLGGSPLMMFLILFSLFFVVVFGLRIGLINLQRWWRNFQPRLIRFLAKFSK